MPFVYITCKDKEEAVKISRMLLGKRLIACANMWPIESMFWWKERIQEEEEYAILGKTLKKNYPEIVEEVKKSHSYDVPCVCLLDAKANEEFNAWLEKEVK
jgi:periplasmic divalent cation tolerance protein